MRASTKASRASSSSPKARWPTFITLLALLVGMGAAAWQMAHRGIPDGPRNLMILTPKATSVTLDGQPSSIPVHEGVHAFSVAPGPHSLLFTTRQGAEIQHPLPVPAGVGPLMIAVDTAPGGTLEIKVY